MIITRLSTSSGNSPEITSYSSCFSENCAKSSFQDKTSQRSLKVKNGSHKMKAYSVKQYLVSFVVWLASLAKHSHLLASLRSFELTPFW